MAEKYTTLIRFQSVACDDLCTKECGTECYCMIDSVLPIQWSFLHEQAAKSLSIIVRGHLLLSVNYFHCSPDMFTTSQFNCMQITLSKLIDNGYATLIIVTCYEKRAIVSII